MRRSDLWLLLVGLVVALFLVLGIRLPVADTAAALLALVVAGLLWRTLKGDTDGR